MKRVELTSLGQLAQVDIHFGDMTLFVGQQASGKSILLQLIKLILDADDITRTIKRQGFDWRRKTENFLALYFGEGMQGIWNDATNIIVDSKKFELEKALALSCTFRKHPRFPTRLLEKKVASPSGNAFIPQETHLS